jgi:Raf kinase inhibitor-like YbhB/YbcL family protein
MTPRLPILFSLLALAGAAEARPAVPAPFQGPALAQDQVLSRAVGSIQVSLPRLNPDGTLPVVNSGYGRSTSFPVSWTAVPGAKAYAVIVQDLQSGGPVALTHWAVYNIPAAVTELPRSVHDRMEITGPKGFLQGLNSLGGVGYVGPKPPVSDPPHRLHVQVFALTRMLPLGGGATLDKLVQTMGERVLAEGEAVVTFQAPQPGDAKPGKPKS